MRKILTGHTMRPIRAVSFLLFVFVLLAMVPGQPAAAAGEQHSAWGGGAGGQIGGIVWRDLNANGRLDPGEPGIPGVKLSLLAATPGGTRTIQYTWSNYAGYYAFAYLPVGRYAIVVDNTSQPLLGARLTTGAYRQPWVTLQGQSLTFFNFGFTGGGHVYPARQYPSLINPPVISGPASDGTASLNPGDSDGQSGTGVTGIPLPPSLAEDFENDR